MKKSLVLIACIVLTMRIFSQPKYDCIGYDEFYLLKTSSDVKGNLKIKGSDLKSNNSAEQIFGTNYTDKQYINNINGEKFNAIDYKNGLSLDIPENPKVLTQFRITSIDYTLYLKSGQSIKIGMKSSDLKTIFPKSYDTKAQFSGDYMKGKTFFNVYFCAIDGKNVYIPAGINFILNEKEGILEEIRSFDTD